MASWWIALGYPPFDDGKGGFPRTGQVVKYYREQTRDETEKRWTQRKLALCLNVTEQTVRDMENRDASLECERRRRLCECFALPPILLGVLMRQDILKMVEQHKAKAGQPHPAVSPSAPPSVLWWVELEYPPFDRGKDGFFPRTGQVVKHYREQKRDATGKPWTQRGLALALDVTEQTVRDLENRDANMDFDRRQILSRFLTIPPILLGIITPAEIDQLVEQQRTAKRATSVVSTPVSTSRKLVIDVEEYTGVTSLREVET